MKGLNALEIIFTLFVLIVVVLVVVRMFITRFTFTGIEQPIQDITETYNYEAAYSTCNSLCNKYEADCGNTQNAIKFCLQKANIDIDGDRIPGEKGHYNVVEGVPMCEDGIYCFHIKTDCSCGTMRLNAKTCLTILCDYYQHIRGYSEDVAANLIGNEIKYGTCPPDAMDWMGKIEDYNPIPVPEYDSIRNGEVVTDITLMGPDHWWATAGYNKPCGVEPSTAMRFECSKSDSQINCRYYDLPEGGEDCLIMLCKGKKYIDCNKDTMIDFDSDLTERGDWESVDDLDRGDYVVILQCPGAYKLKSFYID